MESEFPGNSKHAAPDRSRQKNITQLVESSDVVRRKKPIGRRLISHFVGGDARTSWAYILFDQLLPDVKYAIWDGFTSGIERTMFPDSSPRSRSRRSATGTSHISYNKISQDPRNRRDDRPQLSRRARALHDFDEIILPTRVAAEEIIDQLFELISKFDQAQVADLYEMLGVTSNYPDQQYGWTSLQGARAVRTRGGYLLDLPRPEPLE